MSFQSPLIFFFCCTRPRAREARALAAANRAWSRLFFSFMSRADGNNLSLFLLLLLLLWLSEENFAVIFLSFFRREASAYIAPCGGGGKLFFLYF